MRKTKVGQDFNSAGIKYPCAVDNSHIPAWMPLAFWVFVVVEYVVVVGFVWWALL